MTDIYGTNYKAAQELRNAGLSPESINAIQDTTVITRDGAQHVVRKSEQHFDDGSTKATNVVGDNNALASQLEEQRMLFNRYKNYSEQRITKLEVGLSKAITHLNEMINTVQTLKSNAQAAQKREELYAKQEGRIPPSEKPIDRNKVAPADVQVENIFYTGRR